MPASATTRSRRSPTTMPNWRCALSSTCSSNWRGSTHECERIWRASVRRAKGPSMSDAELDAKLDANRDANRDAELDAWIDAHFDEQVRFLQELVRVPTDTPPGDN